MTGDTKELALNCSVEIGLVNEKTDTRFEFKLPEENIVKEVRRAIAIIKDLHLKTGANLVKQEIDKCYVLLNG